MALVILLSALVGGLLTGLFFLLHRSKKTADTAENAMAAQALARSQLRLQDYAIGQMLKGNTPDFTHLEDFYRVFRLEFPAEAFMLLTIKLRRYPGAGQPDAQENAYRHS